MMSLIHIHQLTQLQLTTQPQLLIKLDYLLILVRNGKASMILSPSLMLKPKPTQSSNSVSIGHNQELLAKSLLYMMTQQICLIQLSNYYSILINHHYHLKQQYFRKCCTHSNLYTEDIFNKTPNNAKVRTEYEIEDLCVWVDPLDGTLDFVTGDFDCVTTLIGVSYKKQALIGIISQPFVKIADKQYEFKPKIYFGHHPQKRVFYTYDTTSLIPFELLKPNYDPSNIVLCTQNKRIDEQKLQKIKSLGCSLLQMGGSGKKSLTLLEGKASLFIYLGVRMSKWDICAPDALFKAFGGRFLGLEGQIYDYNFEDKSYDNPYGHLASIYNELVDKFLPKTTGML